MASPLDKYLPEVQKQKQKFKEVFGEKVSKQIEKEVEEYKSSRRRSRGGGSSSRAAESEAQRIAQEQAEKQKQLEIEQTRKAEEQAMIEEQREVETASAKRPPLEVQPFDPLKSMLPLPSKKELGVQENVLSGIFGGVSRESRMLINEPRQEDLTSERGLFIGTQGELFGDITVQRIPTGTTIDSGSGIKTEFTQKDIFDTSAILGGGAGTPREFIIEDIERGIISKETEKVSRKTRGVQERIDTGELTLEEGKKELKSFTEKRQSAAELEFEKRVSESPQLAFKSQFESQSKEFSRGVDISAPLKTGAIIGGLAVAPEIAAPVLLGLGGAEAFSIVGRPTGKEKLEVGIEAALDIGIGGASMPGFGTAKQLAPLTKLELERKSAILKEQPFAFGEVRLEQGTKSSFRIKGGREAGGLSQEINILGKGEKLSGGKFIIPEAKGTSVTTGILGDSSKLVPKQPVAFIEEFSMGAKGFSFPLGEKITGSVGTSTFIDRKGVSKVLTGGISKRFQKDLIVSRTGKVTGLVTKPSERQALIQMDVRNLGLTKVVKQKGFRDSFEITGGGKGLKTNMDQITKSVSGTDVIKSGVSQKLGTGIDKQTLKQFSSPKSLGIGKVRTGLELKSKPVIVRQKLIERQFVAPMLKQSQVTVTSPRQKGSGYVRALQSQLTPQALDTGVSQLQTPRLRPIQKQLQMPKLSSAAATFQSPGFDLGFKPNLNFGFAPVIPMIPGGLYQERIGRGKPGKKEFFRTPSFAAVQLGIESSTPSKLEFTGLVERPVIKKKRRK